MPFTLRLHRVLKAPPERVYRAFTDPAAMCKWLPPHGFTGTMHHMEPKVGGSWRMSFTNLSAGATHTFGGNYLELQPGKRLRYTSKFDDTNLPGEMITTVELSQVFCGTEMQITQEGIPDVIPSQASHLGWQESLALLTQLVEPDIPNG